MAPNFISRCACGSNSIPLDLPLPLHAYICHCTSCRTRNGSMYVLNAFLRSGVPFTRDSPPSTMKAFTPVPPPGSHKDGSLFFCSTCSSLLFMCFAMGANPETGEKIIGWSAVIASLSVHPDNEELKGKKMEDLVSVGMQFCASDTVDGGAAVWTVGEGDKVLKHGPRNQDDVMSADDLLAMQRAAKAVMHKDAELDKTSNTLTGKCYCKAVTVSITRDDAKTTFRGSHCACDTCRVYSAVEVMSFVHVPLQHITVNGNKWPSADIDAIRSSLPEIKIYESSDKAFRGSCATCGSSVFWMKRGREVVEFAAGMFGSEGEQDGIRREGWVDWKMDDAEVSHLEDSKAAGRAGIIADKFAERYTEWIKSTNVL